MIMFIDIKLWVDIKKMLSLHRYYDNSNTSVRFHGLNVEVSCSNSQEIVRILWSASGMFYHKWNTSVHCIIGWVGYSLFFCPKIKKNF